MAAKVWMCKPVTWFGGDAVVQAWLTELHEAILEVGMLQAADTGQIDPYTATAPTTASTNPTARIPYGYLMYVFNDPLQSAMPIFVKISLAVHGHGIEAAAVHGTVQVGSGSNGAGELTGSVTDSFSVYGGHTSSGGYNALPAQGVSRVCFSPERGFFGINFCPANQRVGIAYYAPVCFFVSRTQDASGGATSEGATLWAPHETSPAATGYNQTGAPLANVTTARSQSISLSSTPPVNTTRSFPYLDLPPAAGSEVLMQRTYHRLPAPSACYNLAMVPLSAFSEGQEFLAMSGGVTESNFVALGHTCAFRPTELNTGWGLAMLFE